MGCDCYADAAPDFYMSKERTANKEHQCSECNRLILPGQKYRYASGKWEGYIQTFKICEKCSDITDNLVALGYCISHGGLEEDYQEYLDDINSDKKASEIMRSN